MKPRVILCLATAIAVAPGLVELGCDGPEPSVRFWSDDEMIANLHAQPASFDRLVTMLDTDRKIRYLLEDAQYADTGGRYEVARAAHGSMTGERWDTYARLLARTRAGRNVNNDPEGILFTQWVEGAFVQKNRIRGYYYARTPPRVGASTGITYRPIVGRWYLFSLRRDGGREVSPG